MTPPSLGGRKELFLAPSRELSTDTELHLFSKSSLREYSAHSRDITSATLMSYSHQCSWEDGWGHPDCRNISNHDCNYQAVDTSTRCTKYTPEKGDIDGEHPGIWVIFEHIWQRCVRGSSRNPSTPPLKRNETSLDVEADCWLAPVLHLLPSYPDNPAR